MAGLTTLTTRTQLIDVNNTVQLTVQFTDQYGNPISLDTVPKISIISPTGLVYYSPPTSAGVMQLDVGKYQFNFTVPFNGPYGMWNDVWQGISGGKQISISLQFAVVHTDLPAINDDGYIALGDDPGFNYSQNAIHNINKILKPLKARLNNDGKAKSTDQFGNVIYIDCSVFSTNMLVTFIANAITEFNALPHFTFFTFEDTLFIDQFLDILVERATIDALASQALIERGREFQITDNGVNFNPPTVSELLNTQYTTMLTQFNEKLKFIKGSMKPAPISAGTFRIGATIPALRALRHRRENQIV